MWIHRAGAVARWDRDAGLEWCDGCWMAPDGVEAFGRLEMGRVGARACVAMVLVGSFFSGRQRRPSGGWAGGV